MSSAYVMIEGELTPTQVVEGLNNFDEVFVFIIRMEEVCNEDVDLCVKLRDHFTELAEIRKVVDAKRRLGRAG